jgi:hypothetical protein
MGYETNAQQREREERQAQALERLALRVADAELESRRLRAAIQEFVDNCPTCDGKGVRDFLAFHHDRPCPTCTPLRAAIAGTQPTVAPGKCDGTWREAIGCAPRQENHDVTSDAMVGQIR